MNSTQKSLYVEEIVNIASRQPYLSDYTCTITNQYVSTLNSLRRKLNTNTNRKQLTVNYELRAKSPSLIEAQLAINSFLLTMNSAEDDIKSYMISIDIQVTDVGPVEVLAPTFRPTNYP